LREKKTTSKYVYPCDGKSSESVQCAITGQYLRMRHMGIPSHAFGRSPFNNCRTRHPNPNLNPNPNSYPNITLTINLTLTLILTVSNPNLNSNPTLTLTLRKVRKWTRAHAFSTAHCTDSEDLPM